MQRRAGGGGGGGEIAYARSLVRCQGKGVFVHPTYSRRITESRLPKAAVLSRNGCKNFKTHSTRSLFLSLVSPFRPRVSPLAPLPFFSPLPLPASPSLQFAFSRYSRVPSQREQMRHSCTYSVSRIAGRYTFARVNVALSIDNLATIGE